MYIMIDVAGHEFERAFDHLGDALSKIGAATTAFVMAQELGYQASDEEREAAHKIVDRLLADLRALDTLGREVSVVAADDRHSTEHTAQAQYGVTEPATEGGVPDADEADAALGDSAPDTTDGGDSSNVGTETGAGSSLEPDTTEVMRFGDSSASDATAEDALGSVGIDVDDSSGAEPTDTSGTADQTVAGPDAFLVGNGETVRVITDQQIEELLEWAKGHNTKRRVLDDRKAAALVYLFRNCGQDVSSVDLAIAAGCEPGSAESHSFVYQFLKRFRDGDDYDGYTFRVGKRGSGPASSRLLSIVPPGVGTTGEMEPDEASPRHGAGDNGAAGSTQEPDVPSADKTPTGDTDGFPLPTIDFVKGDEALWDALVANAGTPLSISKIVEGVPGPSPKATKQALGKLIKRLRDDPVYGSRCIEYKDGPSVTYALNLEGLVVEPQKRTAKAAPPLREQTQADTLAGDTLSPYTKLNNVERALLDYFTKNVGTPVTHADLWSHVNDIGLDVPGMRAMDDALSTLVNDPAIGSRLSRTPATADKQATITLSAPPRPAQPLGSGELPATTRRGLADATTPRASGETAQEHITRAASRRSMDASRDVQRVLDYILSGTGGTLADVIASLPPRVLRTAKSRAEADESGTLDAAAQARLAEVHAEYESIIHP